MPRTWVLRSWALVRDLLPVPSWMAGRGGWLAGYSHRQMIDAVRYLVDNGIKWRATPCDFPPWPRVYAFFVRWRDAGLVGELHDRLRGAVRCVEGRKMEPSAAVVDSQSVKADATVTHASQGVDAGKKINGRKRHAPRMLMTFSYLHGRHSMRSGELCPCDDQGAGRGREGEPCPHLVCPPGDLRMISLGRER